MQTKLINCKVTNDLATLEHQHNIKMKHFLVS